MSDFGSLGAAWLISEQLSTYRLLDGIENARMNRELATLDLAWRQHCDHLAAQHNNLVAAYNALLQQMQALQQDYNKLDRWATGLAKDYDQQAETNAKLRDTLGRQQKQAESDHLTILYLEEALDNLRKDHPHFMAL